MKNKQSKKTLSFRLNGKLFSFQLLDYILLDITLIVLMFLASFFYAEWTSADIIKDAEKSNIENMEIGTHKIHKEKNITRDHALSPLLRDISLYPSDTKIDKRYFSYDATKKTLGGQYKSITYNLAHDIGNDEYLVVTSKIGTFYHYATICLIILLIFEAISLIGSLNSNRKAIAKTLEPLRDLSEATQAISGKGQLTPQELRHMAKALDAITATDLDKGIPPEMINEELRPLAAAINEMLTRIDDSYKAQLRFVSDASHELRTPIAVIQGYANLLSRWGTEDKETLDESIDAIKAEADSMKELINQLLFLARGDTESMHIEWEDINASLILAEVEKEVNLIDKTHIIESNIEPDVIIKADAGLLKQLLRILTDNAIKYTPDGGKIFLSLKSEETSIELIVQDEGIGIPQDAVAHIFDRFYRTDESRTRETGGAGLGLSIAKWIAEKHNGSLEVLSREGLGTRFTIQLYNTFE